MATLTRALAAALAAGCLALGPAACGGLGAAVDHDDRGRTEIGVLLPDKLGRWESFDRPSLEQSVRVVCGDCAVRTVNADGDVATQQQQIDSMVTGGADALIVVPIDAVAISTAVRRADDAGVPVVAYDRLAEGPVSAYVSFDNEEVGRLQGRALMRALDPERAARRPEIVMINGAPNDPNSAQFTAGAMDVMRGKVTVGASYDTFGWTQDNAFSNMSGALLDLGADHVDGVYAANDSLASGVLAALKAAHVDRLPPVTGQDAELAAVRRVLAGEQYMTVYKPFHLAARPAAAMAVALARGRDVAPIALHRVANDTVSDVPAVLATPTAVTRETVAHTVVKDGLYTVDEICTPDLAAACRQAGLTS